MTGWTHMSSVRRALGALLCLLLAGCSSVDQLNRWPFAEPETERLPGDITVLGPVFDMQWKESTVQWGVRPLFSVRRYQDVPLDGEAQFDVPFFAPPAVLSTLARRIPPRTDPGKGQAGVQVLALYPLFRHESCGPVSRTIFLPLYYNARKDTEEAGHRHHWILFPLYFGGHTDSHGTYHAVFPLGGVLKGVFGRDKIRFVLFPLYSHATTGERESYYVLFPFIRWASGGGRNEWHFWPIVGRMQRRDQPSRWFFLWPFFWHAGEGKATMLFPLAGSQEKGDITTRHVIWPLFSYAHNSKTGRRDYVSPWPILRIGNGPDYRRFQVWPLFGTVTDRHVSRQYVAWPLLRFEQRETETAQMTGRSLFIIYRSIQNEWLDAASGERSDYENILWPAWYYKRDGLGNTYFATFALRGIPDPQGWDRFYSFIWRVYEHETRTIAPDSAGDPWQSTRALWGMFRYDRDDDANRLRVFPLFESEKKSGEFTSFKVIAGMFGFEDRPGKRTYKILFVPWTVDRDGGE